MLIFSKTWKKQLEHIQTTMEVIYIDEPPLFCKPSKCVFGATELLYLGHCFSGSALSPNSKKLEAVIRLPSPSEY